MFGMDLPANKRNVPWTPFQPPIWQTEDGWTISRKNTDKLPILSGTLSKPEEYKLWRKKISDHCSTYNDQWSDLLEYSRKRAFPITKAELMQFWVGQKSAWSLSKDLFNFMSNFISTSLQEEGQLG